MPCPDPEPEIQCTDAERQQAVAKCAAIRRFVAEDVVAQVRPYLANRGRIGEV